MASRQPSDFTVAELKEVLKSRGLLVTGGKAELIARLEYHNPDIWEELDEERRKQDEEFERQAESRRQRHRDEEDHRQEQGVSNRELLGTCGQPEILESQNREVDLLRRERDLLAREVEVMRRERESRSNSANSPSFLANMFNTARDVNVSTNISIRSLSELICDFDGSMNTFAKWEQQIELLRINYKLDDNMARVLISSKLKGRASDWFHSKAEHLNLPVQQLLREMKTMFDHRPSIVALRKEFENRNWKTSEPFMNYYHEKVILGNRVPIRDEEIVDYLIDGMSDINLQNQARAMCYTNKEQLLNAFRNITLLPRKTYEREVSKKDSNFKNLKSGDISRYSEPRKTVPTTCYNCSGTGHISKNCTKPRREKGSCFRCGSMSHQYKECSQGKAIETAPRASTSAVVQPVATVPPYIATVSFVLEGENGDSCKCVLGAMLDSGSPISLIKESIIPRHLREPLNKDEQYFGLNNSKLAANSIFKTKVDVDGIITTIRFLVVPDDTMSFVTLLGRDFISNPLVNGNLLMLKKEYSRV